MIIELRQQPLATRDLGKGSRVVQKLSWRRALVGGALIAAYYFLLAPELPCSHRRIPKALLENLSPSQKLTQCLRQVGSANAKLTTVPYALLHLPNAHTVK